MISKKKGFEIQFHWIFVLIAGSIIIAFFFSFALKQRAISTEKISLTLSADIENVLSSAYMSAGTSQILPVPLQGITFECSKGCDCYFRISRASRPFGGKSIFSPTHLKDKDLIVWSVAWNTPFRATNFLFITNQLTKYYIIYNPSDSFGNSLAAQFKKMIPENIITQYNTISDNIAYEGYAENRLIYLNVEPQTIDNTFKNTKVTALYINPASILSFHEKIGKSNTLTPTGTSSYSDILMMLAAVFSENQQIFECNIKSAFKRLSYVSEIYSSRAKKLQNMADNANKTCIYGPSIYHLNKITELSKKLSNNIYAPDLNDFKTTATTMERINRDVIEQSCPELF